MKLERILRTIGKNRGYGDFAVPVMPVETTVVIEFVRPEPRGDEFVKPQPRGDIIDVDVDQYVELSPPTSPPLSACRGD